MLEELLAVEAGDQSTTRWPRGPLRAACLVAAALVICFAPAISVAGGSKLYPPSKDEIASLRLAEVIALATRKDILGLKDGYQQLLASGLQDSALTDSSLAVGRVYCCHGWGMSVNDLWFYVPPDVPVEIGDIVEIRLGRQSSKQDPGQVNVATQVRQKKDAKEVSVRWEPPNERLWMRVLYADWMPAEGWEHKKGLHETWLKRAPRDSTR